ncbi:MAG: L-histidine N(alpha)-methyltransferase [Nitrospirales bacterium]|nr:L-histidine N(alpha)-methyltransferase [Nitrospirales bacterium]
MNNALATGRIEIMNYMKDSFHFDLKSDVLLGLTSEQKSLPSKYFYDARGSELFDSICRLPEYYQTRTELSILRSSAGRIVEDMQGGDIVELGSGANLKIRALLDASFRDCRADICYVPVDVSESALLESSAELLEIYPGLKIRGIVADFMKHMEKIPEGRKRLFLFFGSTIGNFSDEERRYLLESVAGRMEPEDRFLLGIDMIKPADLLERAYNDRQGITAEFNRNILRVLNRELGADFETSHFDHLAFYNDKKEQVEMHLRANRDISAEIRGLGLRIDMDKGETIHTEICRKFSMASAGAMAEEAGLRIGRSFSDPQGWFSLLELAPLPC